MDEIHFFYINCDQDTERKKNMEKQWLNISKKSFLHRYRATHFNTINPQYLTETTKFSNEYVEKNENKFAPSIAVFKSHIGLWKKIIDKQIKYAIIFEDDVFIPDNFLDIVNEEMGEFCKNTDKWDILFFGVLKLYAEKTNNPKWHKILNKRFHNNGLHAYMLNYDSVRKLYKYVIETGYQSQIDIFLRNNADNFNFFAFHQNIIQQEFEKFPSTRLGKFIDPNITKTFNSQTVIEKN